jgi:hypothetical protein
MNDSNRWEKFHPEFVAAVDQFSLWLQFAIHNPYPIQFSGRLTLVSEELRSRQATAARVKNTCQFVPIV